MSEIPKYLDSLLVEFRRGTVTIGVLSQLYKPQYRYVLVTKLNEKGLSIEAGTLYPLLRRLEKQGLLESEWDTKEARPRKHYFLSEAGKEIYIRLKDEWENIVQSVQMDDYRG